MEKLFATVKTLLVVVLAGASLVASFYFAYVLVLVLVLGIVAAIAYFFFTVEVDDTPDYFDFKD